jgi:hypothetical protein
MSHTHPYIDSNDESDVRKLIDPFFPEKEFETIHRTLAGTWTQKIKTASDEAERYIRSKHSKPEPDEIGKVISIYSDTVSGSALTRRLDLLTPTASAYQRGKRETDAESYQQTKSIRKDELKIQIVDGMTESDAIRQLKDQIVIAAGDFWDTQLQDSIENEMKRLFSGELSRDELSEKFNEIISKRLTGEVTLGDSYFKQLAHHTIVRTRSLSKFGRAKELGAKGWKPINPLDTRTSEICRKVVEKNIIYPLEAVQEIVDSLLTARSTADLKHSVPFWTSGDEDRIPFPPLHWGECRTTIRIVFI